MENIIKNLNIPKCLLRYLMINFLDLESIKTILLNVKCMNILDNHNKQFLQKAKKGFQWNCRNGHLQVAQWLYSLGHVDIDCYDLGSILEIDILSNRYNNNKKNAFMWSCKLGLLQVAQLLYNLGGVDIHYDDEYAFRLSCRNGYLEVAQWLYNLGGVNIHAGNEYAFRWSCSGGHLDIAQWLYSLGGVDIHACDNYVYKYSCNNVLVWLKKN